jgi:hypothetical protein
VSRPNENGPSEKRPAGLPQQTSEAEILHGVPASPLASELLPEVATRAKQRARQQTQQNRFVIVAAGAIVTALLVFVALSMPHRSRPQQAKSRGAATKEASTADISGESEEKSLFPITDSGRPAAKETHQGFLNEQDLRRAVIHSGTNAYQPASTNQPATLGSIPPFGDKWQAPPYEVVSSADAPDGSKTERDAVEKSSVIYLRQIPSGPTGLQTIEREPEVSLGLAAGTRLRAHLESAASTAVRAPVLAVIDYNYEQNGEIIVPAGAKAVGHIRQANGSGYVDLQFDALQMSDDISVPIEAAATDLDLRPLKGKVEGKNTGKNVLVRSLSGIGQAASVFLGQGSLNQPLSESDLMRERLASNIGETGDEEVSRLAVNQQIVVTVSAGVAIYVVLQRTSQASPTPTASARSLPAASRANMEQLRQLLELQQELNQSTARNQSPP